MACWFHCCGCSNCNRHMFDRKILMWVAQGGDSLWGVRMAAIHDYCSPDCHIGPKLSQAKDFDDQTQCSCLIGATGSLWTSELASLCTGAMC
ncbi:MARVEL domain-containing protein [Histoplasma capsulatum G186AR]|uniref:MARVEL domain-containing protein n=1 Tax=Ajellomyces capsulatus TaxID=5037 RepID=A0A8H7Z3Y1_AJECA|nr:MARVEL domain-containing protein [Histoplasma capsulatum]QSS69009.1 MARVEL domain-containing protein [Histoplasma capsulatum G186AR]